MTKNLKDLTLGVFIIPTLILGIYLFLLVSNYYLQIDNFSFYKKKHLKDFFKYY